MERACAVAMMLANVCDSTHRMKASCATMYQPLPKKDLKAVANWIDARQAWVMWDAREFGCGMRGDDGVDRGINEPRLGAGTWRCGACAQCCRTGM